MKIEIHNRWTNACIWSGDIENTGSAARNLGAAVVAAHKSGANLDGARLDGANLDGANLDGASLDGASLVGASLDGANLDGANLVGASLDGASLVGASLDGASLVGARLVGARLDGARLDGASLDGASLDGASLDGASLDGASLDDGEKLLAHGLRMIGPIGSRSSYCTAYATDKGLRFRAGCFFGDVEAFAAKITASHGDNHHAQDYRAWIAMCEAWFARLSGGVA